MHPTLKGCTACRLTPFLLHLPPPANAQDCSYGACAASDSEYYASHTHLYVITLNVTLIVGIRRTTCKLCERRLFFYAELRKMHFSAIAIILTAISPFHRPQESAQGRQHFFSKDFTTILRPWNIENLYLCTKTAPTPLPLCDPILL
uniref:Secreted peptide n=1 Tax=Rhipicephalus pulchellus TaxID=72859 RepID=L7LXM6_RHIPC